MSLEMSYGNSAMLKDFKHFIQRMQRDRAVSKVYSDFVEAATAGAIALVEGKITPLNPNEPLRQHVYVYNQIFFSFAVFVKKS